MLDTNKTEMLPMGAMLNGRYRIEEYLASGGFGNTYVAIDMNLETRVAIKEFFLRMHATRMADGYRVNVTTQESCRLFNHYLEKFKTEARRISKLRNNHIVHVIDLFESNGTAYYVMDFIEGVSLRNEIRRRGAFPEQKAFDIARQLLDALNEVHKAGFCHLDLNYNNVMLTHDGQAILIDFGASKQLSDEGGATMHSQMIYTPGFAPSEQTEQEANCVGPWTDFYSLGATIYVMVTNTAPPAFSDILNNGDAAFHFSDLVSSKMQNAIIAMMNPSYKKRPQNVDEVWTLLEQQSVEQPSTHENAVSSLPFLPVGTLLNNRYRVESILFEKGFTISYNAVDIRLNKRVSIQEFFITSVNCRSSDQTTVLLENKKDQPVFESYLHFFKVAMQKMSKVRNKHIISVHDIFDENGTSYCVTSSIVGKTVDKLLPFSEEKVCKIGLQLIDGLQVIHEAGLYYFDIKPKNVVIDNSENCTLFDLGLAHESGLFVESSIPYTSPYASPELKSQMIDHLGPWTEFYSVGATLYELLTDERPPEVIFYDGDDYEREFDFPESVSIQMRHAIIRMMNPNPQKRPQTIAEMRTLLRENNETQIKQITNNSNEVDLHHLKPVFDKYEDSSVHYSVVNNRLKVLSNFLMLLLVGLIVFGLYRFFYSSIFDLSIAIIIVVLVILALVINRIGSYYERRLFELKKWFQKSCICPGPQGHNCGQYFGGYGFYDNLPTVCPRCKAKLVK